jgi:hypothetical protein
LLIAASGDDNFLAVKFDPDVHGATYGLPLPSKVEMIAAAKVGPKQS